MSGAEAIAVLGVISSIISIIDGTKKVYDAATNARGLPEAFREVADRLPIIEVPVICGEGYTPTLPRSNGGWGGSLNDYDLIEVLDSTSSSSKDPLDLLSYKRAQELQQSGLRLGEGKGANTDSSSSVHSRSDGSTSEPGRRHCSLNTLRPSEAGSEAGYDP